MCFTKKKQNQKRYIIKSSKVHPIKNDVFQEKKTKANKENKKE